MMGPHLHGLSLMFIMAYMQCDHYTGWNVNVTQLKLQFLNDFIPLLDSLQSAKFITIEGIERIQLHNELWD